MSSSIDRKVGALCPVAKLDILTEMVGFKATTDYTEANPIVNAEVEATITATMRLRNNPLAWLAGVRQMGPIATSADVVVTSHSPTGEDNPLLATARAVAAETLFTQLGSNCLKCTFAQWCPSREDLAEKARNPATIITAAR